VRVLCARSQARASTPAEKGGGNASDVTPPPAMMKQDPNMPRGGYPETARFWPVKNMPGMHIVLLKPGDVPYPISERMAEKFESFRFNHGLWVRKPGTFKWRLSGRKTGATQAWGRYTGTMAGGEGRGNAWVLPSQKAVRGLLK